MKTEVKKKKEKKKYGTLAQWSITQLFKNRHHDVCRRIAVCIHLYVGSRCGHMDLDGALDHCQAP